MSSLMAQSQPESLAAQRQAYLRKISTAGQAGDFTLAVNTARQGIALAERNHHDSTKCVFSLFAGMGYYELSRKDSATYFLREAVALADKEQVLALQVRSRQRLADVYMQLENWAATPLPSLLTELEKLVNDLNDPRYIAGYELLKGNYHNKRQETSLAVEHFLKSLEIYRSLNDRSNVAGLLTNLGGEVFAQRRWKESIVYYQEAVSIFKALGREHRAIEPYLNIGKAYDKLGNLDSARHYTEKSLTLATRVSDRGSEADAHVQLARLLKQDSLREESKKQSAKHLQKSSELSQALGSLENQVYINIQLGDEALKNKKLPEANRYFSQALDFAKQSKQKSLLVEAYKATARYYKVAGQATSVFASLEEAWNYQDSIYDQDMLRTAAELETKYQTQLKEQQIAQLKFDNELNQLEQEKKQQLLIFTMIGSLLFVALVAGVVIYLKDVQSRKQVMLKERELFELNSRIAETRQIALRAQMNPHFIFNCMAAADGFILKNERNKASDLLTRFAKMVRQVLENSEHALITLEQEFSCLDVFLSIEQMRFHQSFSYSIKVSDELLDFQVPPLLFQPFVENALIHGIGPSLLPDRKIEITAAGTPEQVTVRIKDNGIGRDAAANHKLLNSQSHHSMGIRITTERLNLLESSHGVSAQLEILDLADEQGVATGTEVIIRLVRTFAATA
ncbi:MAG: histidine kinase [Cyclobacteriaceae bacterium]|nr:histidine kinase [Cyclobacteriaceae bacterium]